MIPDSALYLLGEEAERLAQKIQGHANFESDGQTKYNLEDIAQRLEYIADELAGY